MADAAPNALAGRHDQIFPVLTEEAPVSVASATCGTISAASACSPPARRTGYVRRAQGGRGGEDVETLLVLSWQLRELIIAEADLGERIVRAMILRRVALIEAGASGPVLIGKPASPELLRLQGFLRRNAHPHSVVDAARERDAAVLLERYRANVAEVLAVCPDGTVLRNPSCKRHRRDCASSFSTVAPSAARPAPAPASRTTSAFRRASPAWRLPGALSFRHRNSELKS
jgi:hypothetical protein